MITSILIRVYVRVYERLSCARQSSVLKRNKFPTELDNNNKLLGYYYIRIQCIWTRFRCRYADAIDHLVKCACENEWAANNWIYILRLGFNLTKEKNGRHLICSVKWIFGPGCIRTSVELCYHAWNLSILQLATMLLAPPIPLPLGTNLDGRVFIKWQEQGAMQY